MDRRELQDDPVEAQRAALDGRQAEVWTALPGIIQSFDPDALTVSVQSAINGVVTDERGQNYVSALPPFLDVPVVFPHGGGFSLTFPIKPGDECLVVFASRCIDGWWQSGGVQAPAERRMHDLSDGIAIPGPWSQALKLTPGADADNVQLRTDDGKAYVALRPDYTIEAVNPAASLTLTPGGVVSVKADAEISLDAPRITISGNLTWTGQGGGAGTYDIAGALHLDGTLTSTGDQVAEGISTAHHVHSGVEPGPGSTGGPV